MRSIHRSDAVKTDFEKARDAKRAVYRSWDVTEEDVSDPLTLRYAQSI